MYDEMERALGGTPRRGLSVPGWIGVLFVGFCLLGIAGTAAMFLVVRHEVEEVVETLERDGVALAHMGVSDAVAAAVAGALAGVEPELLAADAEAGRMLIRNLRSGEVDPQALDDLVQGYLRIRTDEGEVTAELRRSEEGGTLVIRSPEGEARVEGVRGREGGTLTIQADGETVQFGSGGGARGLPGWVPPVPGVPADARRVLSAVSGPRFFSAVSWEADDAPAEIVDRYRERLEDEGYSLRSEHALRGPERGSASVMGRDDDVGRLVFLLASRENGATRVVLGYGEGVER